MSKVVSELATRCELALMGRVVALSDDEVVKATEYMMSAMGIENPFNQNFLEDTIQRFCKDNHVTHCVCNKVMDMRCITYCLEYRGTDEDYAYPAPFTEDYGTGTPCAFSYVLNLDCDWCSEFGDVFFRKDKDGFYHRAN